jgi:16S rRNA (guanine527-N7)-methyltransferase
VALKMSPEEFSRTYNVSRETISRLQIYHDLLIKWQKAINLISPKTLNDIWMRHFADSAQLSGMIPRNAIVSDLGSGAGFPAMILAVMRPDLKITLIESDSRKCEFLKNVSRETKCAVTIYNERIEKFLGKAAAPDFITARAFASLSDILEAVPDNCSKATLLLLKGKTALEEVKEAKRRFNFEFEDFASQTDPGARILKVSLRS